MSLFDVTDSYVNNHNMKKILLLSLGLCAASTMMADLDGAGYYRVENYVTKRYISLVDNRGKINISSTTADLQAICLDKNFERVSSDAASILYIQPVGSEYNIAAQGTSLYEIIGHYVTLVQNGSSDGQKIYMAYGEYDGAIRYLGDQVSVTSLELGQMSTSCRGDYRKWYILPVDADSDNYFGAKPTVNATAGLYTGLYCPLYGSFPFSNYSPDVKVYVVDKVSGYGQVTLKEVTGVVPKDTPVIIKCEGETSSDNRLNIGGDAESVTVNSDVKGVYFNCSIGGHINRVEYDADTMRVLGVCEDGSLGFITSDIDYIDANSFYLSVPSGSPSEYKIVDEASFTGVNNIEEETALKTVYTLTGIKVAERITSAELHALPKGIYIVNGKKVAL